MAAELRGDVDVAAVGALLAEPARVRILQALDGRALPAGALAAEAGVAPSTGSEHLARLVAAGFLTVEAHGRHRYYRLADPAAADLLESMARLAPQPRVRSLRQGNRALALRRARSCYDHVAGKLGTDLQATFVERGWLEAGEEYLLTDAGRDGFLAFGIDVDALPGRRRLIRHCLDWSERRDHLSGKLGAALLDRLFVLDWVERAPADRSLVVTQAGRAGFAREFGVSVEDA
jgi:DNA-binding transcriptional ArsR family regulator